LPVAAALQGQVPAGLPAALPGLPRSGRARLDRRRDRPRLLAAPHVTAGSAPAHQAPLAAHQPRPGVAARKKAHPIRDDTVVSGRVTRPETAASRQTWPSGPFRGTPSRSRSPRAFGDVVLARAISLLDKGHVLEKECARADVQNSCCYLAG